MALIPSVHKPLFLIWMLYSCAHKEEGSKKGLKCGYVIYEWPRRDMKAGEEVFCSYDYKLDDAPPWYQDLWSNRICKLYKQQKVFWYLVIHILEIKEIYFMLKTMSGSCHSNRALNVEICFECQIFVIVIFFNCGQVLQFGAHSRYSL